MTSGISEKGTTRAQALADAQMFRDAGVALEQINANIRGVTTDRAVACGRLLKRMFPDRAHLAALDIEFQNRFRACIKQAAGRPLGDGIEPLWDTMKKLWGPGGALLDAHHAKSAARVFAAKFCHALGADIERELDDIQEQEEAA